MRNEKGQFIDTPEKAIPHRFKPGESGNPKGRPKGSKNISTQMKKILFQRIKYNDPLTGKRRMRSIADHIALALVGEALKGNVQAVRQIQERLEGKVEQPHKFNGAMEHSHFIGEIIRKSKEVDDAQD